jgi:hypothetical protein
MRRNIGRMNVTNMFLPMRATVPETDGPRVDLEVESPRRTGDIGFDTSPIPVMGKTGTTNEYRDALFVGPTYAPSGITVA